VITFPQRTYKRPSYVLRSLPTIVPSFLSFITARRVRATARIRCMVCRRSVRALSSSKPSNKASLSSILADE
jgi:hypothetical protein